MHAIVETERKAGERLKGRPEGSDAYEACDPAKIRLLEGRFDHGAKNLEVGDHRHAAAERLGAGGAKNAPDAFSDLNAIAARQFRLQHALSHRIDVRGAAQMRNPSSVNGCVDWVNCPSLGLSGGWRHP